MRNIDDEYLLGDSLLVAPLIYEDGTCREVYLPAGRWTDFFGEAVYEGGQSYQIEADYDKIPVFVKENCILPLAEPVEAALKQGVRCVVGNEDASEKERDRFDKVTGLF